MTVHVRLTLIILAVLACHRASAEISYVLRCGNHGELRDVSLKSNPKDCENYRKLGFQCGDSVRPPLDPSKIVLMSPLDTYYSNRDSKDYNRAFIKELISEALRAGTDPYLTIALVMVEGPPVNEKNINYLRSYGAPPLDAIGAISTLSCRQAKGVERMQAVVDKEELNRAKTSRIGARVVRKLKPGEQVKVIKSERVIGPSRSQDAVAVSVTSEKFLIEWTHEFGQPITNGTQPEIPILNVKPESEQVLLARIADTEVGGHAMIEVVPDTEKARERCRSGCCARLKAPSSVKLIENPFLPGNYAETDNHAVHNALKKAMSFKYVETMMQNGLKLSFVKNKSTPLERFAAAVQGYNGYGVFGGSEKMDNRCLSGIDMKEASVYGAGVADLMLNDLIGNSEIRQMVRDSQKEARVDNVKSYLCVTLGEGNHSVEAMSFARFQQRYLEGRPCGGHRFTFKSSNPIRESVPSPAGGAISE